MTQRLVAGFVVASLIAFGAHRHGSLTTGGALAAAIIGTACVTAGWPWGALLIVFFITSTALTRFRIDRKNATTASIVEKGGARDAWQVFANGGAFAAAAVGSLALPSGVWAPFGAGAIAAAASDTWATEIGTLAARMPRSILSGREVAPGTSGGLTLPGTGAAIAGACLIAGITMLVWPAHVAAGAAVGGFAGSIIDSLLGATLQERRWCGRCGSLTERLTHYCGDRTAVVGGLRGFRNDWVNVWSVVAGGAISLLISYLVAP